MAPHSLSPEHARRRLVAHQGLNRLVGRGGASILPLLDRLRCIQLDPLDPIGTNADLVAAARIDDIGVGDVYDALLPGNGFEHFAKERCLLPASAFGHYREGLATTPWWRHSERMKKLDEGLVQAVEDEIRERGPLTVHELTDLGRTTPMDWSGWKGTGRLATLAVEVLWIRCRLVTHSRQRNTKRWAVPEQVLAPHHLQPRSTEPRDFARWGLLERVEACGLLSTAGGPWWSSLAAWRTTDLPAQLVAQGLIEEVRVTGSRRTYYCPAGWLDRPLDSPDDRVRILGPLDPLIWDRKLTEHLFDFPYVWEVYKPADKRRWGWYVVPLLHAGRLVGRLEATRDEAGGLSVTQLWREGDLPEPALQRCLARHDAFLRAGTGAASSTGQQEAP